jgi:hypothetical protein
VVESFLKSSFPVGKGWSQEKMMGNLAYNLMKQWGIFTLRDDENLGIVIKEQAFTPLVQRGK